jgi:beta-aspartyl-peptidase (threonine type)
MINMQIQNIVYTREMKTYSIAIHGGAGALDDVSAYQTSITRILSELKIEAEDGMTAMDLAELAVNKLEDDPIFNAGKGGVLNAQGIVECDAAIMDGRDLEAGAIAGARGVKNPISLARKVITDSPHVMLIGDGVSEFAKGVGVELMDNEYFVTQARAKQLEEAKKTGQIVLDHSDTKEEKLGTVGAVVLDGEGNLAAATSTGGIVNKRFGRVGDSPIVGAGVFAENGLCAVSATGYGEQFIRTTISKHIAEWMRYNEVDAQKAATVGIDFLVEKVKGLGGVVVVDAKGNIGFAHSTPVILAGSVTESTEPTLVF